VDVNQIYVEQVFFVMATGGCSSRARGRIGNNGKVVVADFGQVSARPWR